MSSSALIFYSLFLSVSIISVSAKIEFCSENNFKSSTKSNYLQFTKELSSSEYAVVSSFKSLHCCAKGYRSIQWFKDGKPYPWASDVSTFILYPESANQTIYSQSLGTIDTGNYECQTNNDSQTINHTIHLKILDVSRYTDDPLKTYDLPAEHYFKLGDTARIFCEAFIGKFDVPDARYEIMWARPEMNETQVLKNPRVTRIDVPRADGQIIGSYFSIESIKKTDYGDYICSISNTADQKIYVNTTLIEFDWLAEKRNFAIPWWKVISITSILLLLIIFLSTVFEHILFSILLLFKSFSPTQNIENGKMCDVLVCYSSSDADFIKTTLAMTLQKKYGYSVIYKQHIDPTLASTASQSRSILLLGSPGMCNNEWTPKMIHNQLIYITSLNNNVVFVPVKPIPEGALKKSDDGKKLEELLKKIFVVNYCGNRKSDISLFWIKLRLALPTKIRNSQIQSAITVSEQLVHSTNQSVSTKVKFLMLTKTNDCVEVLV